MESVIARPGARTYLFVLPELAPHAHSPAGMMYQIAAELAARGNHCDIVLTGTSRDEVLLPERVRVFRIPLPFGARWQKVLALTTERAKRRIQRVVSGGHYRAAFVPAPAARFGDLLRELQASGVVEQTVVMAYDTYPQAWVDLGIVRSHWLEQFLLRRERRAAESSAICGLSPGSADFLTDYYQSPRPAMVVPFFGQPPVNAQPVLAEAGPLRLVFGARVYYGRWIEGLIELSRRFPDEVEIDCFGNQDELVRDFRRRATDAGVSNIRFLPALDSTAYQEALLDYHGGLATTGPEFQCPSYPSKAIEYMRVGLPILAVTDDYTDYPDLIERSARCGFAGRSSDLDSAVRALRRLMAARASGSLRQLGENGRNYYREHFLVTKATDTLISQLSTFDRQPTDAP